MSVRWGTAARAACVSAIIVAAVSVAVAEDKDKNNNNDFKPNSTELKPAGDNYKNCSDAAGCGPGAAAPDLDPEGQSGIGFKNFLKHFKGHGKINVKVCDVIV